jgi:hypothetical protein
LINGGRPRPDADWPILSGGGLKEQATHGWKGTRKRRRKKSLDIDICIHCHVMQGHCQNQQRGLKTNDVES